MPRCARCAALWHAALGTLHDPRTLAPACLWPALAHAAHAAHSPPPLLSVPPSPSRPAQIDVEGFEPSVLRGARNLFLQHTVSHLFMEYSPGVAERAFDYGWYEDNPTVLLG